jgi:hypothetical protein
LACSRTALFSVDEEKTEILVDERRTVMIPRGSNQTTKD